MKYKLVFDKGTVPDDNTQRKDLECINCKKAVAPDRDAYYVVEVSENQRHETNSYLVCSKDCADLYMFGHHTDAPKFRKLRAKWTVETPTQLQAVHGLDTETEIVIKLSEEIKEGIDKQIIKDLKKTVI